ncbi:hypothetical protein V6N13_118589 [Hibiscus sabdariffa]|uniref:Uncharacterized protein n=2 Tax=Hibiscus sabdariffa TaxID=183260 RepID=A0ABR2NWE7_9ROSI
MSASPDCDIVGHWGESLDDFSEDEENIVPITEDDDVHLLDVDDVEAVMADASLGQEIRNLFGVTLDHRPDNRYPVIQLMNLQPACMTWTILQCGIENTKLAYLVLHHLSTMENWH